jgi:putative DNA primase/helicase
MTSRLKLVPFTVRIPEKERVPREELLRTFQQEASGILNWAIAGLKIWHEIGLSDTPSMEEELQEWVAEDDVFGQFITECCTDVNVDGAATPTKNAYEAYKLWNAERGEERWAVGLRTFSREMTARGIGKFRLRDGGSAWKMTLRDTRSSWAQQGL